MLGDLPVIAHPEGPAAEQDAGHEGAPDARIPPRRNEVRVADEEGPFAVVFDVKVVVDIDFGVFARVLLGELHDEGFVPLGRVMVAGEEVEHDLDLDDGVGGRRVDQTDVRKIPPRLEAEIFNGGKRDDFSRGVGLNVGRFRRMEAGHVMPHLGGLRHQLREELLHLFLLAQSLFVVKGLGVQS